MLYGKEKDKVYQNEDNTNTSHVYADFIGKVVREDSNMWIRPAKMFFEKIDPNRSGNITGQNHRFEVVTDLNIDYTKKEN